MENPKVSIVIPVFNSEKTLEELCSRLKLVFNQLNLTYQLILVDDGSSDKSWSIIEQLNHQYDNLVAIRLTKNFGQHSALLSGFTFCNGDLVITMDDDLQHPPEEIVKLIGTYRTTNADVVYGLPKNKKHSTIRNVGSKTISLTSEYRHNGSSFRLIKISFIKKIITNHQFNHLFLDALLSWYTGNFEMVEVEHHDRKAGKSGYTFFKLYKIYLRMLVNYSVVPLRILIYGGLLMSFITFLVGMRFVWRKLMFDVPLGYTSLIVAILFTSSLIILGLGFIGLYIHKLYEYNLQKPIYFVNKVLPSKNDN